MREIKPLYFSHMDHHQSEIEFLYVSHLSHFINRIQFIVNTVIKNKFTKSWKKNQFIKTALLVIPVMSFQ